MRFTHATESYNEKRYGRPWLAIIDTSMTRDFLFLDWDGRPGQTGEFSFDAVPGTILAYGQKDNRKGRGGVDGYRICMPDGSLPTIGADERVRMLLKLHVDQRPEAFARMMAEAYPERPDLQYPALLASFETAEDFLSGNA